VFGRVVLSEEIVSTAALAQVSQATTGISNPTPVQDSAGHHAMAMTALGVSLVILVAAVYAIIMMKRWS
jgi:hypothetical protein